MEKRGRWLKTKNGRETAAGHAGRDRHSGREAIGPRGPVASQPGIRTCPAASLGAQAGGEFLEPACAAGLRGVDVLALRDHAEPVVAAQAAGPQDPLEGEP